MLRITAALPIEAAFWEHITSAFAVLCQAK
jgi:hypothetical protein